MTSVTAGKHQRCVNKARSKVSGKWHLTLTSIDAAGAVTDTCESAITGSAKQ